MEGLTFSAEDAHENAGHATDEDGDEAEEPVPAVDPGEDGGGVLEIGDEEENGEVDGTAVTELITFEGAMPGGVPADRCPRLD